MNVQFYVQARLGSTRYPGKVLAPLTDTCTLLDAVDLRLRKCQHYEPDSILYLTTIDVSDDPLIRFLEDRGWDYRRGDIDNVFSRFRTACEERQPDAFVRVCADNP
jgi:spore coat polysaccharide biosynthesis protein SpsF